MTLTFASWGYDRTEALRSGAVKIKGFDVKCLDLKPREIFDRMGSNQDFSAAEFSFTEYILNFIQENKCFVAIPVFPSKVFRHGFIFKNAKAGIVTPKDLEGKRVGVPLYTMTAALWIRGLLQDEYGVDWRSFHWIEGSPDSKGAHGNPSIPKLLKPVEIEKAPTDQSLGELLVNQEIDAMLGSQAPDTINHPSVERLFSDFRTVERNYFIRTRLQPIMHLVVIRRDIHEAHPDFAQALYNALVEAKEVALAKMRYTGANCIMMPFLAAEMEDIRTIFGGDPCSYGLEENRHILETMIRYMVEQDYIADRVPIEEFFLPVKAPEK